jgi:hypothetical protein
MQSCKTAIWVGRLLRRFAPRNDSSGSVFAAHPEHLSVRFAEMFFAEAA